MRGNPVYFYIMILIIMRQKSKKTFMIILSIPKKLMKWISMKNNSNLKNSYLKLMINLRLISINKLSKSKLMLVILFL